MNYQYLKVKGCLTFLQIQGIQFCIDLNTAYLSFSLQALRYLGLEPTAEQQANLRSKLTLDDVGTVNYGGQ